MPNKLFFLFLLVAVSLFYTDPASAQEVQQAASIVHNVHRINSKALKEDRIILVHVPANYLQNEKRFPVIYMLDGHPPQVEMMAGILAQQYWGQQMPEAILVSIQNRNRSRDLTPTNDGRGGRVGGGDNFLDFLEKEVIPLVEKNYRTAPYRIFAGHSLGGLAVVYSFVSRPHLFNAYIAASPVLRYDKDLVIRQAGEVFRQKKDWNKTMFLAIGDEPQYVRGFNKFKKLLRDEKPKGFDYAFREFPEENHASVVLRAYYWGLRKIYNGWIPKRTLTVADLERHHKKLSKKYGYKILIPEETLNRIGYQFLRKGNPREAINVFRKNVANYPNSANVHDSLGEAFEKSGQLKNAAESYKKAFDLATAKGDTRQAGIFKANLERVSGKM